MLGLVRVGLRDALCPTRLALTAVGKPSIVELTKYGPLAHDLMKAKLVSAPFFRVLSGGWVSCTCSVWYVHVQAHAAQKTDSSGTAFLAKAAAAPGAVTTGLHAAYLLAPACTGAW